MVVRLSKEEDAFKWNAVLRGLLSANCPQKAILGFLFIRRRGIRVDSYTILFSLKAFCLFPALDSPPELLHSLFFKLGFESNIIVRTSLLKTYALFGNLRSACKMFDETPQKDAVQWNTLIAAYERSGHTFKAARAACSMINENVRPNEITMVSIISTFSQMKDLDHGRCGCLSSARQIFEKMSCRNEVSWATMINGYTENGSSELALDLFKNMACSDVIPDDVIVLSVVTMCANLGSLELGKWIDEYVKKSIFQGNIRISNALIDMHVKCGNIKRSCEIFDLMKKRSVVSWTSMIHGLALHGHGLAALTRFSQMQREGFKPDEILFLGVMSACNHASLVEEGRKCFKLMVEEHELIPWMEHYGIMVDMLCRAGLLNEALEFVDGMHLKPDGVIWRTLIRASEVEEEEEGRVGVARPLLDLLIKIEPENSENYIMKSSLHAINGEWNNVEDVRQEMGTRGVSKKNPGWSLIEEKHLV